jgi:hypothetical protein
MHPRSTESDMHIQLLDSTKSCRDSIGEQAQLITIPVNAGSTESNIHKQLSAYIEFAKLATKMLQCERGKRRQRARMGASGTKQGMNTLNAAPPQDVIEGGCSHPPTERSNGIHQDGPATSLADKIEENNVHEVRGWLQ